MNSLLVDTPERLDACVQAWAQHPWLAVDTEFVREDTYYPQLCLVQVSDATTTACVDVLALDPGPLWALLHRDDILKVLHAAAQDLELFAQVTGRCPQPLFDTQIAAAALGDGDQIGYAGLIERRLGVTVDKRLARTDWRRRPLADGALAYAGDDVRHLAQIYPEIREELVQRGRLAWVEEDSAAMTDPLQYRTEPQDAWRRLKGLGRLAAPAQARAARLAAWRETRAMERNRPRRWILSDEAIYRLAAQAPQDAVQIAALDVLPPGLLRRDGDELAALLAQSPDDTALPMVKSDDAWSAGEKRRFKALQATVRERAETLGVPVSLLAPRADLERLVRKGPDAGVSALRGWRREAVGEALLAALVADGTP